MVASIGVLYKRTTNCLFTLPFAKELDEPTAGHILEKHARLDGVKNKANIVRVSGTGDMDKDGSRWLFVAASEVLFKELNSAFITFSTCWGQQMLRLFNRWLGESGK